MSTHKTTYVSDGLARLLQQFKGKPRLEAVLRAALVECQAVEDALWGLRVLRNLDDSEGEQLDVLGRILNQPRDGADDDTYRIYLRVRIRVNQSSGTIPELKGILRLLLSTQTLNAADFYPAAIVFYSSGVGITAAYAQTLATFIREARTGGVKTMLDFLVTEDADSFAFDGGTGLGWGDETDPDVGGVMAGTAE